MNLQSLEKKHYIIIVVVLLIIFMLFVWDKKENFDVYPFIPPNNWRTRRRTKWSPFWYYENELQPAVPKVSYYDSSDVKFPVEASNLLLPRPEEEMELAVEPFIANKYISNENMLKTLVVLLLVGGFGYYIYSNNNTF